MNLFTEKNHVKIAVFFGFVVVMLILGLAVAFLMHRDARDYKTTNKTQVTEKTSDKRTATVTITPKQLSELEAKKKITIHSELFKHSNGKGTIYVSENVKKEYKNFLQINSSAIESLKKGDSIEIDFYDYRGETIVDLLVN